jgi:hypothetical protein
MLKTTTTTNNNTMEPNTASDHVWMEVLVLVWSKLTLFIQTHVLVWC